MDASYIDLSSREEVGIEAEIQSLSSDCFMRFSSSFFFAAEGPRSKATGTPAGTGSNVDKSSGSILSSLRLNVRAKIFDSQGFAHSEILFRRSSRKS